jgi:hypothetical protein
LSLEKGGEIPVSIPVVEQMEETIGMVIEKILLNNDK